MFRHHHLKTLSFTLVVLTFSGCALSPQAKHDRALARAKDFMQKKDYSRALLECRTAVQTMPKDAEGYYQLGLVYANTHDLQDAVFSYRKALSLNPGHAGAQVHLAEIMASTADPAILKDAGQRMTELLKSNPANSEALDTLALTQLKLGNTSSAVEELNHALAVAPGALRSSILLAQAKLSQGDHAAAEEVLKKACSGPDSENANIVLAQLYVAEKRLPEAEQHLQNAITHNPQSGPALLLLGKLQLTRGDKADAEQSFKKLSTLPDGAFNGVYGTFLFIDGRKNEGIREFERLAHNNPNDRAARTRLISAYWSSNRQKDAETLLASALQKNPNDTDALEQRAKISIVSGKYQQAETDLNALLHQTPNSAEAHYLLSKVYAGKGNVLQQRQELSETLRLKPVSLNVRIELANLLIQTQAASSGLQVLDEAPAFQKGAMALAIAKNWGLMAAKDMSGARKGIDAALAQQRLPEVLLQDGVWKMQQGNMQAARASFEQVLAARPEDVRALQALYQTYAADKQSAAGLAKLREYAAKAPQSGSMQYLLGQALEANGDRAGARSAFMSAQSANPPAAGADMALIQLDIEEHNTDAAKQKLTAILAANPKNNVARLWLGNVAESKSDHATALSNYQQVVDSDPNNASALNNLAYLLTEYKNQPDEALKYAEKAQELSPNDPDYADTLGWVFYRKGLYTLAVKNFESAVSNPKAAPISEYHLAMAYAKAGDRDRGRAALKTALARNPSLPEAGVATQLLQ